MLTCNVDIRHVSLRNFFLYLFYKIQDELDIICFTLFKINIPDKYFEVETTIVSILGPNIPTSFITVRSHNYANISKKVF